MESNSGLNLDEKFEVPATGEQGNGSFVTKEELDLVCTFIQDHVDKFDDMEAGRKFVFATDVNGVLLKEVNISDLKNQAIARRSDKSQKPQKTKWCDHIDGFFCDLFDGGFPVAFASKDTSNDLSIFKISERIAKKLYNGDLSKFKPNASRDDIWSVDKAKDPTHWPGFLIEDNKNFCLLLEAMGGTGIHAVEDNSKMQIFEIWSRMSKEQKDLALKPLTDRYKKENKSAIDSKPVLENLASIISGGQR